MMTKLSVKAKCIKCKRELPPGEWVNALGHHGCLCLECDRKK